jgi:hypothetical protein
MDCSRRTTRAVVRPRSYAEAVRGKLRCDILCLYDRDAGGGDSENSKTAGSVDHGTYGLFFDRSCRTVDVGGGAVHDPKAEWIVFKIAVNRQHLNGD